MIHDAPRAISVMNVQRRVAPLLAFGMVLQSCATSGVAGFNANRSIAPGAIRSSIKDSPPCDNQSAKFLEAEVDAVRGLSSRALEDLKHTPDSSQKFLITAFIALDAGELDTAERLASRLLKTDADAADVRVLASLVQDRKAYPNDTWANAMIRVLRTVRLKTDSSMVLRCRVTTVVPLDYATLARVPGQAGFLVRMGYLRQSSQTLLSEAVLWARSDSGSTAQLVAFLALGNRKFAGSDSGAESIRRAALAQLLKHNPEAVYLRIWRAVDGPLDRPFDDSDLNSIDVALKGRDHEFPLAQLYDDFKSAYSRVDDRQASEAGFTAAMSFYPVWPVNVFSHRAAATIINGSPEQRQRLATLLEKCADIFIENNTEIDRLNAVLLLEQAARIRSDERLKDRAKKLRDELKGLGVPAGMWVISM